MLSGISKVSNQRQQLTTIINGIGDEEDVVERRSVVLLSLTFDFDYLMMTLMNMTMVRKNPMMAMMKEEHF